MSAGMVGRAEGCLLGQLVGDALGSQVEFMGPSAIRLRYPEGVRELRDGGTWGTLAGQPTDDSEMALLLARLLVKRQRYDPGEAWGEYEFWWGSEPFDVGGTIGAALGGVKNAESQANGAMMRVSPLGIFGARFESAELARMAREDAALTHPHRVCLETNALYAMAIAEAVRGEIAGEELYGTVCRWAVEMECGEEVRGWIAGAAKGPPESFTVSAGWVKIAFWNALYQLLHATSVEEAVVATVMGGGDTDTNAAIAGALLGAVYGREAIPARWVGCVLACRPAAGLAGVHRPRPEVFWPVDVLELAAGLVREGLGGW